jgi:hypothetical protein
VVRFRGDTRVAGFGILLAASVALASSQAWSLGCADIPGARVDPDLNLFSPFQSYGRLLPEFKKQQETAEERRKLEVDRLVARKLVLPDGKGYVWVLQPSGGPVTIKAVLAGKELTAQTDSDTANLDNTEYNGQLAQAFFALGINWRDFSPPAVDVEDILKTDASSGRATVEQTIRTLAGTPKVESRQTVDYACSNKASFVGDYNELPSVVVLRGTIRATQTSVTTTTNRYLDLTINETVEQQPVSFAELGKLLAPFPEMAAALDEIVNPPPADGDILAQLPLPDPAPGLIESATDEAKAPAVPLPEITDQPPAAPEPEPPVAGAEPMVANWTMILSAVAVIAALILLLLFHPRFTARRQRDTVTDPVVAEAEPVPAPAEPVQEPEAEPQVSSTSDQPPKTLESRIAVLETLRVETEQFQEKLNAALIDAASDAADTTRVKQQLAQIEAQLAKVSDAKSRLEEAAQDSRSRLTAAEEENRQLKEMVVELKTRLARANAQIESSRSVIVELESASQMAIELNADYRSKAHEIESENRAMRSRIALLEKSLAERDELLETTTRTNDEISQALAEERAEKASIEDDFIELSKDFETLRQKSTSSLKRVGLDNTKVEHELRAAEEQVDRLESELRQAHDMQRQLELGQQSKQGENARLRVEHGVRTRLLENNLSELSTHIEILEQILRNNELDVPPLELTPVEDMTRKLGQPDTESATKPKSADILKLAPKRS